MTPREAALLAWFWGRTVQRRRLSCQLSFPIQQGCVNRSLSSSMLRAHRFSCLALLLTCCSISALYRSVLRFPGVWLRHSTLSPIRICSRSQSGFARRFSWRIRLLTSLSECSRATVLALQQTSASHIIVYRVYFSRFLPASWTSWSWEAAPGRVSEKCSSPLWAARCSIRQLLRSGEGDSWVGCSLSVTVWICCEWSPYHHYLTLTEHYLRHYSRAVL